ncbi:MAG: peptide chain release factor N(5)-glutamine methyltransferase [Chloroflexota bacterium]|mgnify:CR=1 FL=1
MTASQALSWARQELNPITNQAFWEALALLAQATHRDKEQLLTYKEWQLSSEVEAAFAAYLRRRLNHEPLAYIIGYKEFYGMDFYVDRRVLIPRPETELLVEEALKVATFFPELAIADIGTGCGAIAISLAMKLPQSQIYATDNSPQALGVARINCQRHGVEARVCLFQGDMLSPLPQKVSIIVSNLPYIPTDEIKNLPPEISLSEPLAALDGGKEGLEKIAAFLAEVPDNLAPGGYFLLEVGQGQDIQVQAMTQRALPQAEVRVFPDLAGIPRVVSGRLS